MEVAPQGDNDDENSDAHAEWLAAISEDHKANKTGPIQVPLDWIEQAEFGPNGYASRDLDEVYAETIATDMWNQGILFPEIVECYVPKDPRDPTTHALSLFDIQKYSAPSMDNPPPKIYVFCGQHRTYALKLVKKWIEANRPNGRVRQTQVQSILVNFWVALNQEDALQIGKIHNDIFQIMYEVFEDDNKKQSM